MNDMYYIFGDRKKGRHGFVSNYIYYMKCMKEWDRRLFYSQIFEALPSTAASFLGTVLPSALVAGLEGHMAVDRLLLQTAAIILLIWICNIATVSMEQYSEGQYYLLPLYYAEKYVKKIMDVDYDRLENESFKCIAENAWGSARNGRGIIDAVQIFPVFITSLLGFVLYGFLLARESILIVAVIMISLGISLFLLSAARKKHRQYYGKISKYARRTDYITTEGMDSAAGKDIRIYRMLDWFLKKYEDSLQEIGKLYGSIHRWYLFRNVSSALLELWRDGLAFGFLVYWLVNGTITAAEFVFLIGLVSGFSVYFENMLRAVMRFNSIDASIGYIREFLGTESAWKAAAGVGEEKLKEFKKSPAELVLRNVSFTYPGNKEATIKNINLTIRPGEKLALIGLNGAGKTTLVKLICGLYQPTSGEILYNGIPVRRFNREEYYSLISVLFQDSTLMPLTLDENITGQTAEQLHKAKLDRALELAGFIKNYEGLEKKGETRLVKKLNEDAADFSGGELQKLLFARAVYQEAPLVILDEPTAALDPIAENELYQNYGKAMENRTSVYISHRLSSTRFCDRIVLLESGRITEEGTHEELLAGDTRYAQLYEMQSKYYREQAERRQKSVFMGDEYVHDTEAEEGVFNEQK